MIPLAEAQAHVLGRVAALVPVERDPTTAVGLVAATSVAAREMVPAFDNTAMDGFAVRAADTAGAPVRLAIVGTMLAGAADAVEVGEGEAVRIMTGAPIPPGADSIVMVERTEADGDTVVVQQAASVGDHVRRTGDDVRPGDELVRPGDVLTAARVGLLAGQGVTRVSVHPSPRVGVLSTGDELVADPTRSVGRGQLRDSNRPMLLAHLAARGFEPVDLGWIGDDPDAIRAAIVAGAARCDALVTSGGVSMGEADLVKVVLDELGEMTWMQIAIKPAKPFAFGVVDGTPVFGLPGNPVSALVSFELLARPALRALAGHPADRLIASPLRGVADEALHRRPDGKTHYLRVAVATVDGVLRARPAGGQGSHQLAALGAADALAVLVEGEGVDAGDPVDLLPLL